MSHPMARIAMRVFFFIQLGWLYAETYDGIWPYVGFMLVAEGLQFAVSTVRDWDVEARRG